MSEPTVIKINDTAQLPAVPLFCSTGHKDAADFIRLATAANHGKPPEKVYRFEGSPLFGNKEPWILWYAERP